MQKIAAKSPVTHLDAAITDCKLAMEDSGVAVRVESLSKIYKLYPDRKARLVEALHPLRRKYHRDFHALNNINLEVKNGEILGIVGKNGSGKSTLLKIIYGLLQPTSGSVLVNGAISALIELGAGFNPELTGLENIYFYGSVLGFSKQDMEEKLDDILSFADIGEFINQPLKVYSSGMNARLAFSVSTAINPDIFIVDEILSVGDAIFQRKCYAKIENMFNTGKAVLLVSHNREAIVSLCENAILLERGELIFKGKAGEVVREYEKLCNKKFLADSSTAEKLKKSTDEARDQSNIKAKDKEDEILFDPSLVDDKPVYYKKSKVNFESFGLYSRDGHKVNILKPGDNYTIKAKFKFEESLSDLTFALRIKSIHGSVMSWIGYPFKRGNYLECKKNDVLNIELEFDCNLQDGIYSIDAGLQSMCESDIFHHLGIANIYMFKIKRDLSINYFGPVNFNFRASDMREDLF
jgi:lipopolysaccharide transport system ATP-binding protein